MNRAQFFRVKNAILIHALASNLIGVGAAHLLGRLDAPLHLFADSPVYRSFQIWLLPFAFVTPVVLTLLYERPIRKFLNTAYRDGGLPGTAPLAVQQRLLNEPFFQILLSFLIWSLVAVLHSVLFWTIGAGPEAIQSGFFLSLLTGLVTVCIEFFVLEFVLQRVLAPHLFPGGNLSAVPGTIAISIRKRLVAMVAACNLVPFAAVLLSLDDHAAAQTPSEALAELKTSLFIMSVLFMGVGIHLAFLVSSNLTRPLREITRVLGEVRRGNLDTRVRVTSNDELGYTGDMINAMNEGLKERDWIKETFGKYVSEEIRDEILSGRLALEGEMKEASVLFADIRGFTRLVEKTPPPAVVKILNRYFARMESVIHSNEGLVLQYIGDEIEAVFGAPLHREEHPLLAVRAALGMRRGLVDLNGELKQSGYPSLSHGIGIHTGRVLAASIGSPKRLSYALVGDTVNMAARLQELNKEYGTDILVSDAVFAHVRGAFRFEALDSVRLRGKTGNTGVYSLPSEEALS
jgi:adenylate cyclase